MAAPDPTNPAAESASSGSHGAPMQPSQGAHSTAQTPGSVASLQPIITPIRPQAASQRPSAVPQAPHEDPEEPSAEESGEDLAEVALRNAPPWLISALFHTLLMIVLALVLLPTMLNNQVDLEATFADSDQLGEQLEFDSVIAGNDEEKVEEPILSVDLPEVPDPLLLPPVFSPTDVLNGPSATSDEPVPNIGTMLNGRDPGTRKSLLKAFGGTKTTEAAVQEGLKWLAKNQQKDGSWSLVGPYPDGANAENREAATAMALLAFQGNGSTTSYGEYQQVVKRGWYYLLKQQDADGSFFRDGKYGHRFYTQGQVTIALCELYGMTRDPALKADYREPAEKAVDYCVKSQSPMGGWKYTYKGSSDVSVTGWILMGLQSARMAGLDVPQETLAGITKFLDRVAQKGGSRYPYEPGHEATRVMTAEGLLCRQYLGWKRNNPSLLEGVSWLLEPENELSFTKDRDVYYGYYATQVLHHMEGEAWQKWNRIMCVEVPKAQVQRGAERGSWDPYKPTEDEWAPYGGRLYVTCLSIYMLEVYYRHLPLYTNSFMYIQ